jgi:hypothetical protein
LPQSPWSLKPSHQLPAKRAPTPGQTFNTAHYTAPSVPNTVKSWRPYSYRTSDTSEYCLLDMPIRSAIIGQSVLLNVAKHRPPL